MERLLRLVLRLLLMGAAAVRLAVFVVGACLRERARLGAIDPAWREEMQRAFEDRTPARGSSRPSSVSIFPSRTALLVVGIGGRATCTCQIQSSASSSGSLQSSAVDISLRRRGCALAATGVAGPPASSGAHPSTNPRGRNRMQLGDRVPKRYVEGLECLYVSSPALLGHLWQ